MLSRPSRWSTVARFYYEFWSVKADGTDELLPENPDFKTISVDLKREAFAIEGVAVGVIRNGKPL